MQIFIGLLLIVLAASTIHLYAKARRFSELLWIERGKYSNLEVKSITQRSYPSITTVQVLYTDLEEIEVIAVLNSPLRRVPRSEYEYVGSPHPAFNHVGYARDIETARKHGDRFKFAKVWQLKDGRVVTSRDLTPRTLLS